MTTPTAIAPARRAEIAALAEAMTLVGTTPGRTVTTCGVREAGAALHELLDALHDAEAAFIHAVVKHDELGAAAMRQAEELRVLTAERDRLAALIEAALDAEPTFEQIEAPP